MPTLLITGANRGLGLEFVRQYAADGWEVVAACRRPDDAAELKALSEAAGGRVQVQAVDVADAASVAALKAAVGGRPLDLVIAGAGVYGGDRQDMGNLDYDLWMEVLRVNTLGPVRVAEAFADNLAAAPGAKLVAVTSLMGSIADSSGGAIIYRSSKAALNMAFKSVAISLKPRGITAMVMHPGWVRTDMGGGNAPTTPEQSIRGMRQVIDALTPQDAGTFRDFTGKTLAW